MAKLAVLFLAALAFQATVAVPKYFEEGSLVNYLDEIKTEVKDLTIFFEKDFPEHNLAVKTVTWQCNRLVEVLEVIINKLREETFVVRGEQKVFKDVIYTLEELVEVLRKVSAYNDITNIHELKKYFVITINTVFERFEKLVTLTNTYYPEFRYTLKYLLVDFVSALQGIRAHFVHISTGFEVVQTPRLLIKEIHEYTREFTEILKEFVQPTQVKVALRRYLHYVDEIVRRLQDKEILGHKELDVVIYQLTSKLREIVFQLNQIMNENIVDMKVFRTKIVADCFEIVSVFEQLVQLCEDKVLPQFLVKVIYHYWYAVKHVTYEIKFGNKIGFFMPEYYNTEFYTKYGYGLYDRNFNRFYTPYNYENRRLSYSPNWENFERQAFSPYRYESRGFNYPTNWKNYEREVFRPYNYERRAFNYPMYYQNLERDVFTPYRYESLFPIRRFNTDFLYGRNRYYNNEYENPIEIIRTMEILVKRINEQFQYNTFEVKELSSVIIYQIREFVDFLDFVLEKFESSERFFANKYFEELKNIRMDLREIVRTGIFMNAREIRMRFVRSIEVVAANLYKWIENYETEQVFIKDICYRFVNVLRKILNAREYGPTGYFVNTQRYYPTFYNRYYY